MKRGRCVVGSRMDETGPYLPACKEESRVDIEKITVFKILGPENPINLKSTSSFDENSSCGEREKMTKRNGSSKQNHRKQSLEKKSKDVKKKNMTDKKISKHHK